MKFNTIKPVALIVGGILLVVMSWRVTENTRIIRANQDRFAKVYAAIIENQEIIKKNQEFMNKLLKAIEADIEKNNPPTTQPDSTGRREFPAFSSLHSAGLVLASSK
jgi:hypothetical protein